MTKRKYPEFKRGGPQFTLDRAGLREKFFQYVEETEIPIAVEFAYQNGLSKTQIYEIEELAEPLKMCTAKKESVLEKGALKGEYAQAMAIFSLKQLGWRQEVEHIIKPAQSSGLEKLTDAELEVYKQLVHKANSSDEKA